MPKLRQHQHKEWLCSTAGRACLSTPHIWQNSDKLGPQHPTSPSTSHCGMKPQRTGGSSLLLQRGLIDRVQAVTPKRQLKSLSYHHAIHASLGMISSHAVVAFCCTHQPHQLHTQPPYHAMATEPSQPLVGQVMICLSVKGHQISSTIKRHRPLESNGT